MPVLRLEPSSTDLSGSGDGVTVVGAATVHAALSDASDSSYIYWQVSQFEQVKRVNGDLTDLPDGAGVVNGVVINVRANKESGTGRLDSGDGNNVRLSDVLNLGITDYATASLTLWQPAAINALTYRAGVAYVSTDGPVLRIYRMNFDVSYEFVNGVTVAVIWQWLGPLVAVGLHEMPRLARELWRRSGMRLRPHELAPAWREIRGARHRMVFA